MYLWLRLGRPAQEGLGEEGEKVDLVIAGKVVDVNNVQPARPLLNDQIPAKEVKFQLFLQDVRKVNHGFAVGGQSLQGLSLALRAWKDGVQVLEGLTIEGPGRAMLMILALSRRLLCAQGGPQLDAHLVPYYVDLVEEAVVGDKLLQ